MCAFPAGTNRTREFPHPVGHTAGEFREGTGWREGALVGAGQFADKGESGS